MLTASGPMQRLKSILLPAARGPVGYDPRAGGGAGATPALVSPHTTNDDGSTRRTFCLDFDELDDPEAVLA
jgi:hypothetical protein